MESIKPHTNGCWKLPTIGINGAGVTTLSVCVEQTVEHIVLECLLTKFKEQIEELANLSERAINYLNSGNLNL